MNKVLIILVFCVGFLGFAQTDNNLFQADKMSDAKIESTKETKWESDTKPQGRPGNPGEPQDEVSIDKGLPLLMLVGLIMFFYYSNRQKTINN